jgi:DNA-binding beta-propeller fold protein YncE
MSRLCLLLLVSLLAQPLMALAAESPRAFFMAVWPDRIRILDEETEQFVGEIQLRHGAVTDRAHTPDYARFFYVTDRMESVEVIEPGSQQVVDELKLSTPERKVRIYGLAAHPDGNRLYLSTRSVQMEADRFEAEEPKIIVYDLGTHSVKKSLSLPNETGARPTLVVSRDGTSVYAFGNDIYELDPETLEIKDKIVLSEPLMSGYGPFEGLSLSEAQPDIYYGLYRSKEPFLEKSVAGVARLDLAAKRVDRYDLGTEINVRRLAISPDGKRGYAGLNDLVSIDLESHQILLKKEKVEQGRINTSMIVSYDGAKLYVSGVGDTIDVYDTSTLEPIKNIFVGGDFTSPLVELPRSALGGTAENP